MSQNKEQPADAWSTTVVEKKEAEMKRPELKDVFQSAAEKVKKEKRTTLRVLGWAGPGKGKTSLIMSAPKPLYIITTEPGWETVYDSLPEDMKADVFIVEAFVLDEITDEPDPSQSLVAIDNAIAAISRQIDEEIKELGYTTIRTVAIDTVTDVWRWIQRWWEHKQGGKPNYQFQWQGANTRYENLMLRLTTKPVNLILTAKAQEKYDVKGQPTGIFQERAQKETAHWIDVKLYLKKEPDPALAGMDITFSALIEKNRLKETVNGKAVFVEFNVPENKCWPELVRVLEEQYKVPASRLERCKQ